MQLVDVGKLLDEGGVEALIPDGASRIEGLYQGQDGMQFRSAGGGRELIQEIVRLTDEVFLLASDHSAEAEQWHRQLIGESDWLHIQFRLKGCGSERVSEARVVPTPEKSCVISRYPKGCTVERKSVSSSGWRAVCLHATPKGFANFLGVSSAELPERAQWMLSEAEEESRTDILPLESALVQATHDVLSCSFGRAARRLYLRAKAIELASIVLNNLSKPDSRNTLLGVKLSVADVEKLAVARSLMAQHLESSLILAELAHRVGLNRTKLALGFKQVYGTSVQAYWRDLRLIHARELLRDGDARVTDVALSLGYSELSSFTRAFSRKFGVLPTECRSEREHAPSLAGVSRG